MQEVWALCRAPERAGHFAATLEGKAVDGSWMRIRDVAGYGLCKPCFEWVDDLMVVAEGASENDCQLCEAALTSSYLVEVADDRPRNNRAGLVTNISDARICVQCFRWWEATFQDSSAAFGRSNRKDEGPQGGWRGTVAYDVESVFMSEHDGWVRSIRRSW